MADSTLEQRVTVRLADDDLAQVDRLVARYRHVGVTRAAILRSAARIGIANLIAEAEKKEHNNE